MYFGGFLTPIHEIDPDFKLDPGIYTFDNSIYFDAVKKTMNGDTGKLMSVPINPNIPLLYYRADLYKEKGLEVPTTLDALRAIAKALNDPPRRYGIVQRGARDNSIAFDFWPYLYGFGGALFRDPKEGDFTVMINSPKAKEALDYYVALARTVGHPKSACPGPGRGDPKHADRQGRAHHGRGGRLGADGRFQQVDRRRQGWRRGAAGAAGGEAWRAARPFPGRRAAQRAERAAAGCRSIPEMVPDGDGADPYAEFGRRAGAQGRRCRSRLARSPPIAG